MILVKLLMKFPEASSGYPSGCSAMNHRDFIFDIFTDFYKDVVE